MPTTRLNLVLYSRDPCPLCEDAAALLDQLGQERAIDWEAVDIEGDLELIRRYGNRIPVVAEPGTGASLAWPFDLGSLRGWLDAAMARSE